MGKKVATKKNTNVKLDIGTVYQKEKNGTYYFRYQVLKERKCVSLKTKNQEEAIRQAQELVPVVKATNAELISTHVKIARKLALQKQTLPLKNIWDAYSKHPQRALPATVREQLSYHATLDEFLAFLDSHVFELNDVTSGMAIGFAEHLRTTQISVSTHNRKIIRLRKIFEVLKDYRNEDNPFAAPELRRKDREEQGVIVRRIAFSRDQEQAILKELDNPQRKIINKPEVRVIYYLGMYTGQRLKDCVLLQWDKVDFSLRRVWVKQFKTGKEVSIPIADPLYKVLKDALEWKADSYVCPNVAARYQIVDERGKGVGDGLVNIDMLRVIKWIGLEPSVKVAGRKKKATVYGFHSLRHSFASHCAEAGIPKAVVVSILGANSEIVDRFYTHVGEDAQRAAIDAISGGISHGSDRERIDRTLAYINELPNSSSEMAHIVKLLSGK
ncbi:MAG: tyrosine-type recombinase/integrase [Victivallaceae bacterium]|nr:tyrosine-type recombinase/integrase [Victivallaceae bacterium]